MSLGYTQAMQQHGQLPRHRDIRVPLPPLLRQPQAPPFEGTAQLRARLRDMRRFHEQPAQQRVAFLTDPPMEIGLARLIHPRYQTHVGRNMCGGGKSGGIWHSQVAAAHG